MKISILAALNITGPISEFANTIEGLIISLAVIGASVVLIGATGYIVFQVIKTCIKMSATAASGGDIGPDKKGLLDQLMIQCYILIAVMVLTNLPAIIEIFKFDI